MRSAQAIRMEPPREDSPRSGLTIAYSRRQRKAAWSEASDVELLAGMRRDDELALDELMRRKASHLLHLATSMVGDREDARDIVQIAFLRIWDSRQRFDQRYSPNTWIYRIVSNLAIDHLRSRASRIRSLQSFQLQHDHQRGEAFARQLENLSEQEVQTVFQELASTLSEKQRAVFVLREMEGLKGKEIAHILGIRPSTVRNHLFNSRRQLRKELQKRYPEYAQNARGQHAGIEDRS